MRGGAGGGKERRRPPVGGGHAQLDRQARHQRRERARALAGAPGHQERAAERGLEGGRELARGEDDDQPVDGLGPPAEVARDLRRGHPRDRAQVGENALGHVEGVREQHAGRGGRGLRRLERADTLEDATLGLLAEPLDGPHAPGLARGPQRRHRVDAEGGVERLDLPQAEMRDAGELAGSGGKGGPDLLERLRPAAPGQVADHRGQAPADAG